jgi:hypothetical protein
MTPEPTPPTEADQLPTSVWQGEFSVCGVAMKCHVLSDGRRIIEAESIAAFLEALATGEINRAEVVRMAMWMHGK